MRCNNRKKKGENWALEPALFLLFFGGSLSLSIMANQILKQTCLYTFKYSLNICAELVERNSSSNLTQLVEEEIQPYAARITMANTILHSIVPTILCLFLGPWSDKYGRKKVFNWIFICFTTTVGYVASVSCLSDYYKTNSPWNYSIAQIPLIASGGLPTLANMILCYVTDITYESDRSIRLTIVEMVVFFGMMLSIASASFIIKLTDSTIALGIAFICSFIGTMIMIFFVEETIQKHEQVVMLTQLKNLFTSKNMRDLFTVCVQKRNFKSRRIIWGLTTIMMLTQIAANGFNTVFYLFTRQKFGWTLQDVTLFESGTMLINLIGSTVTILVFKKLLNLPDLSLSILALTSFLCDAIIKTFAFKSWHLYLASATSLFKYVSRPMLRSVISTVVAKEEISKIFSITTAFEGISGFVAAPLYTEIYAVTLKIFPSAFNIITIAIFTSTLVLVLLIAKWMRLSTDSIDTKL